MQYSICFKIISINYEKNFYENISERLVINYKKLAYSFTKNTFNNIEEKQNEKKNNNDENI